MCCFGILTERFPIRINHFLQHYIHRCVKMFIGAGTVITEKQVELTQKVGGKFIISPDTYESVIQKTRELNLVSIPGALTPSEIQEAHRCGADYVK